jgi:hypothetical protein
MQCILYRGTYRNEVELTKRGLVIIDRSGMMCHTSRYQRMYLGLYLTRQGCLELGQRHRHACKANKTPTGATRLTAG